MSDKDYENDEMNITEIYIGVQNSGKSWTAMDRAARIAAERDCYLVIHDTGSASIRKKSNPYHESDWKSYKDRIPPQTLSIYCPDIVVVNTAYAEDALVYADKIRRKKDVVVLIDEVTAASSITPQSIGEPWKTRIAQRRALRTALLICMQSPTMASRFMNSTATSLKCFYIEHQGNLKALKDLGYTDEDIARIPTLGQGEFIERRQGFGSSNKQT